MEVWDLCQMSLYEKRPLSDITAVVEVWDPYMCKEVYIRDLYLCKEVYFRDLYLRKETNNRNLTCEGKNLKKIVGH